jgi:hypothetical protein
MSQMAMPYHFSLAQRRGTSSECRACKNLIPSDQAFHTIVVRWEQEYNELDFCQACYDNHIQQYFNSRDSVTSTEQPGLLEFLSKPDA